MTVDDYIANAPQEAKSRLKAIRALVHTMCPELTETISWGMPSYTLHHQIFHFSYTKKHIGIYPGAKVMEMMKDKLTSYSTSKGTLRLPYDQELPEELIKEILELAIALDRS